MYAQRNFPFLLKERLSFMPTESEDDLADELQPFQVVQCHNVMAGM